MVWTYSRLIQDMWDVETENSKTKESGGIRWHDQGKEWDWEETGPQN
jgi:hypothetical protein